MMSSSDGLPRLLGNRYRWTVRAHAGCGAGCDGACTKSVLSTIPKRKGGSGSDVGIVAQRLADGALTHRPIAEDKTTSESATAAELAKVTPHGSETVKFAETGEADVVIVVDRHGREQ